jgi:hypothetical protein
MQTHMHVCVVRIEFANQGINRAQHSSPVSRLPNQAVLNCVNVLVGQCDLPKHRLAGHLFMVHHMLKEANNPKARLRQMCHNSKE